MPDSITFVDRTRANFDGALSPADLRTLIDNRDLRTLQTSTGATRSVWKMLDRDFFAQRPDVALRVYGHYNDACDLSFCEELGHVRHFLADCLTDATNVEAIASIPHLESLSLGVFELQSLEVLERIPDSLESITLGSTRSKKPDVASLARFSNLRRLYLEGHTKGIDAIGTLANLEDLTLRSISTPDVDYLRALEKLWSLDIKLGGIKSLAAIEGKASIKYLELWQVRGMSDVGVVAQLPGLQNLFLQSLRQVTALPPLVTATALRRITLQNMGGLRALEALREAPALQEFALIEGGKQQPEDLIPMLQNPAVKMAGAGFGSRARNERFEQLRQEHGKRPWEWQAFVYQ